jgi:L-2-hydroxyglutarate oxidase LhgO
MRKYSKSNFIGMSMKMVNHLEHSGFGHFLQPGIRAQLLHKDTLELVQDFVLEGDQRSMHVLNAVSPAFTCSFPFASYVVEQIATKRSQTVHTG